MHRLLTILIALILSGSLFAATENSKYFVFIGEKISLDSIPPKEGKMSRDSQFLAKYKILKPYKGLYSGSEVEFTVFDHYGTPAFSKYKHVLLFVVLHEGKYFHSKYQYIPLYKTKAGKWAGTYSAYDYNHSYNKNTKIKPVKIDFTKPVNIDVTNYDQKTLDIWFPKPYYKIENNKAIAVYGNFVRELFLLRQHGVLRARGDFQ